MSRESAYVPVSALGDLEHPRIIWRVALPDYAPAENILVNVDRLNRLAFLGGMESLRIASYAGDTTQVTPEVNSVNQQGAATATMKGSISKAETQKADASAFEDLDLPYQYQWTRGVVSLNIPEIDEKVARKSNLRDPKQWSRQLDKALRAGVRDSSWESLIAKSTSKADFILALGGTTIANIISDGVNGIGQFAVDEVEYYTMYALVTSHMGRKILGSRVGGFSDRKHSLMMSYPLDRYFAVNAMTRTRPLVKGQELKKTGSIS